MTDRASIERAIKAASEQVTSGSIWLRRATDPPTPPDPDRRPLSAPHPTPKTDR
jgi:hypothetical protein